MTAAGAPWRATRLLAAIVAPTLLARSAPAETVPGPCDGPATRIHAIQGRGLSSPLRGREGVVVDAVVTGSFPGLPEGLGGFFVQEEDRDADADPLTSEGLFVFDAGGLGADLAPGQRVRVSGRVGEFFGLTELTDLRSVQVCPSRGPATPVRVALPVAEPRAWERWEGMAVAIEQPLVATGQHGLVRFGEVELAAGARLWQPTQRADPGEPARRLLAMNRSHAALLDDGSDVFAPDPPPYLYRAEGGTLRLGDTLDGLRGVVEFAFGRYRIHPTEPVRFEPAPAGPAAAPRVAGTLRVAVWNVQNFMNGDGRGGGFPTRGARSPAEAERQLAKLVATLASLDPHVAALVELENDGAASDSAIAELRDALAARMPTAGWKLVDAGRPRLGSHAIAVGLLYRADAVAPLGPPAVLDADAHPDFDDARNRPSLAQSFRANTTGERFTVAVSHFKSKGSSCASDGDPDLGDGQGECNATRTGAARALAEWISGDPTGAGGAAVLVTGDLNAYPREDPLRALAGAGYVDLLAAPEDAAHSFVFSGQAGRLDHALASPRLVPHVGGARVWHTNSDASEALDYRAENPAGLYAPDPWRASDHDPLLVGLFPDTDGDGLADASDACPASSRSTTLVVRGCDSGVPEQLDAEGCTLAERLEEHLTAGAPLARVASTRRWLEARALDGSLARRHMGAVLACAARTGGGAKPGKPAPEFERHPAPRGG